MCIDVNKTYTAKIEVQTAGEGTAKPVPGAFTIKLDPKAAPITVNNFVFLAACTLTASPSIASWPGL